VLRHAGADLSLFSWLFGRATPIVHFEGSGGFAFEIVGESFYQDALARIVGAASRCDSG
jgi:hypothetical protein